jgi:ATP-dependent RNA helicase DHX29
MPKKKKTQQKPIPRGVAVTSIPKKAPPEPLRQDDSDAKIEFASTEGSHTAPTHDPVEDETVSRQKAEERALQDLVDRLQERTEKEIVRTIKVRGCTRHMSRRALAHSASHSVHRNG